MQYSIDLAQLYRQAFGYVALPHIDIDGPVVVDKVQAYSKPNVVAPDSDLHSFFGTPIFMPCKLQSSKRGDALEYYMLPNEPLIEINGSKKKIETEIDGNDGTFKQLFTMKDWAITIRGIAVNESDPESYPDDQIRMIRKIFEIRNSVNIITKLTTLFGVKLISIDDLRIPPVEGAIGWQPYEFVCKSDKEFDIELISNNG